MKTLRKCPLFAGAMLLLAALAALSAALPARTVSQLENRSLKTPRPPTLAGILSGSWMEHAQDSLNDQFPLRDGWVFLHALTDRALLRTERNGILIGKEGWLFERLNAGGLRTARRNLDALRLFGGAAGQEVWLLLVPLSWQISPGRLPWLCPAGDAQALAAELLSDADGIRLVWPLAEMREQGAAQLYYRTDHHWTAEGARRGYLALMKRWGMEPAAAGERLLAEGFLGTYYSRAADPLIRPEALSFDSYENLSLFVGDEAKEGLWDPAQLSARDKYAALLYGSAGRKTLLNPEAAGTLLVLCDSYANALLPSLAQHFGRVEAVDLRYFSGDLLKVYDELEVDLTLCLYGINTLFEDRSLILFSADWQ